MTDTPKVPTPHRLVDEDRKRIYIKVLADTGSHSAAARAASPHLAESPSATPGYSTFRDLRRVDPDFAAQCDEAIAAALGRVEDEIVRRSFEVDKRPIFDRQGQKIGEQVDSRPANQLLLRLAEKLNPDDWAPRKHATVEAKHQHTHRHEHEVSFELRPEHIAMLPEERQRQFVNDLQLIRAELEQPDHERESAPAGQGAEPLPSASAPAGAGDNAPDDIDR